MILFFSCKKQLNEATEEKTYDEVTAPFSSPDPPPDTTCVEDVPDENQWDSLHIKTVLSNA